MLLINKNNLNSDSKKFPNFTVIGNPLDLAIYTGTPVVFYCLSSLYWQH